MRLWVPINGLIDGFHWGNGLFENTIEMVCRPPKTNMEPANNLLEKETCRVKPPIVCVPAVSFWGCRFSIGWFFVTRYAGSLWLSVASSNTKMLLPGKARRCGGVLLSAAEAVRTSQGNASTVKDLSLNEQNGLAIFPTK